MKLENIRAVLFDLDGTLVDTAPDLGYALNLQRARHGLPPLADDIIRPQASHGARGLLGVGFDLHPDNAKFASMREEFLQLYADNICRHSRPFDGILDLLAALDTRQLKWGVVTNKPARFTDPLMAALGLSERAASIISGDTCANPKPHPEPLLCASREIAVEPQQCAYVGDAERDMEAAIAAGMRPIVAHYGYLGPDDHPEQWSAHSMIENPLELLRLL